MFSLSSLSSTPAPALTDTNNNGALPVQREEVEVSQDEFIFSKNKRGINPKEVHTEVVGETGHANTTSTTSANIEMADKQGKEARQPLQSKLVVEVLESYLNMISVCLNFSTAEVWSEVKSEKSGVFSYDFVTRYKVEAEDLVEPLSKGAVSLLCRKVTNGLNIAVCKNKDGQDKEGKDVSEAVVGVPLFSMNENNFVMVARTKSHVGDSALFLLKAFSEVISKTKESCFRSVSVAQSVESASEREHRRTLELILSQALELQYENVSSKKVGDIVDADVVTKTSKRSLDQVMEAVKEASSTIDDNSPRPQGGLRQQESRGSEKEPTAEGKKLKQEDRSPRLSKDIDLEMLNDNFTMEMFNSPLEDGDILNNFRFTKSSFDLSRMSFLNRRKSTTALSKNPKVMERAKTFLRCFLRCSSFDAVELFSDSNGVLESACCIVQDDSLRGLVQGGAASGSLDMLEKALSNQQALWETNLSSTENQGKVKASESPVIRKAREHNMETVFASPVVSFCQCVVLAYSRKEMKSSPLCLQFVAKSLTSVIEGMWSDKVVSVSGSDTSSEKIEVEDGDKQQQLQAPALQYPPLHGYQPQPYYVPMTNMSATNPSGAPAGQQAQGQQQQQINMIPAMQMMPMQGQLQGGQYQPQWISMNHPMIQQQMAMMQQQQIMIMQQQQQGQQGQQQPLLVQPGMMIPCTAATGLQQGGTVPLPLMAAASTTADAAKPTTTAVAAPTTKRKRKTPQQKPPMCLPVGTASASDITNTKTKTNKKMRKPCRMEGCDEPSATRTPYCAAIQELGLARRRAAASARKGGLDFASLTEEGAGAPSQAALEAHGTSSFALLTAAAGVVI
eukprot:CAMPEP_0197545646 /NCGR_PEP_ID=MMETSP1320-20131121/602_1 /TAXON_ID=91990 /ORGANISM="Bolidomonas sp., Strain RCC2347" /LENGTH=845 /DNA_ID=CAMNT_0043105169 /DNA_START=129 /DNA_END=2667 /DNA_ORIENTATION=+